MARKHDDRLHPRSAAFLMGQDSFRTDWLIEMLNRDSYWRMGGVSRGALSALEASCSTSRATRSAFPCMNSLAASSATGSPAATRLLRGGRDARRIMRRRLAPPSSSASWRSSGIRLGAALDMDRAQRRQRIAMVEAVRDAVGHRPHDRGAWAAERADRHLHGARARKDRTPLVRGAASAREHRRSRGSQGQKSHPNR